MRTAGVLVVVSLLGGCTGLYYKAQERIGNEKRDILVSRVKKGREEQQAAKEQYQSTLEAFKSATGFEGGKLESVYNKLKGEYDEAEERTKDVSNRINSIEKVSNDMFSEWEREIATMGSPALRSRSRVLFRESRTRYAALIRKMKVVEARAKPLLKAFQDQVLFIKHNLNAEAISSLRNNVAELDADVARLIADIEASTREADAFLATLPAS